MKKLVLALLFFISVTEIKISFGQTYHPFPDTLAQWSEVGSSCPYWDPGDLCVTNDWIFCLGHDTIIENENYALVGYNYTAFSTWILGGQTVSVDNYSYQLPGEIFGAIREDSEKKVWYRKLKEITQPAFSAVTNVGSESSDVLLYDFGLDAGDTLLWKPNYNIVESIDSIQLINGEWRMEKKNSV